MDGYIYDGQYYDDMYQVAEASDYAEEAFGVGRVIYLGDVDVSLEYDEDGSLHDWDAGGISREEDFRKIVKKMFQRTFLPYDKMAEIVVEEMIAAQAPRVIPIDGVSTVNIASSNTFSLVTLESAVESLNSSNVPF